jgi:hypothetical protein
MYVFALAYGSNHLHGSVVTVKWLIDCINLSDDPVWEEWHASAYGVQGGAEDTSSSSQSEEEGGGREPVTLPSTCVCSHCRSVFCTCCTFAHLKKLACKRTLRQVFICLRPRTPYPRPLLTHCTLYGYSILIHTGKGGAGGETPAAKSLYRTIFLDDIYICLSCAQPNCLLKNIHITQCTSTSKCASRYRYC